jgi:hypothetical protein
MRTGTARSVTTARPSAASVGARIVAIRSAVAQVKSPNIDRAIRAPAITVSGRPMNNSRSGMLRSPSTSRSLTPDASANSSNAKVSSVMVSAASLSKATGRISRPAGPRMAPAATNTMGAVIHHRSSFEAMRA